MYSFLRIEGDPTTWQLDQPVDVSQWTGETIRVAVKAPLRGTLLLSRRVASVAALNELDVDGGVPNDVVLPTSAIYLPTSSGPSAGSHGYVLPGSVNLTQLAGQISAAMNAGSQLTIDFGSGPAAGVLMLSGAALPFVVLCPAAGVLGEPSGGGGVPND
jgi:hypothetical protein